MSLPRVKVKPASPDLIVRKSCCDKYKTEGETVTLTREVQRYINAGDLIIVTEQKAEPKPKNKAIDTKGTLKNKSEE